MCSVVAIKWYEWNPITSKHVTNIEECEKKKSRIKCLSLARLWWLKKLGKQNHKVCEWIFFLHWKNQESKHNLHILLWLVVSNHGEVTEALFLPQLSYPICSGSRSPGLAADMHFKQDVIAFIGPACAFALEPVARLAAYWNTPIITGMVFDVTRIEILMSLQYVFLLFSSLMFHQRATR